MVFGKVTASFANRGAKPFTHAIVDEAEDLGVPALRMLVAITAPASDALFFAGDLGQPATLPAGVAVLGAECVILAY